MVDLVSLALKQSSQTHKLKYESPFSEDFLDRSLNRLSEYSELHSAAGFVAWF